MKEIWKDIEGYEELYQVSNLGRIKALRKRVHKIIKGKECYPLCREKILKISNHNRNGYLKINITKNNIPKTYEIHRLVAQAFIANQNNLPQVNHKNGIKTDNRVENLEWVTVSQNHKHAFENGLKKPTSKKVIQYSKNNKFIKQWDSMTEASKKMNICKTDISACARGKIRTAGGYKWKILEANI